MKFFPSLLNLNPLLSLQDIGSAPVNSAIYDTDRAALHFSREWQVLGPFQIGTREATWGADPLEFHGGFPSLKYDTSASFPSSLAPNASVSWSTIQAQSASCDVSAAQLDLSVAFPNIDLDFLQRIYGWAALQYQAWARGHLFVNGHERQTIVLFTDNILEFYVDGIHHFGGDYYAFRRAPLVLHLEPGNHSIDLRLIRDVRAMGGVGAPTIDVQLEAQITTQDLHLATDKALLPDMVRGKPASMLGSITVRNDALHDFEIFAVSANDTSYFVWLLQPDDFRVVAGQTRPVSFVISCNVDCSPNIRIDIEYGPVGRYGSQASVLQVDHRFTERSVREPFKMTTYHPGGMVSYAILRAPMRNASYCPGHFESKLPVLLQLHGAGLEAESDLVKHALDSLPDLCAWVLFPTGSTPWSGDDWHAWGFADVEAAISSIPGWIDSSGWTGPDVDTNRWLVSGHSNGGQGTWYALTHRPDKIFAAAPVSGYSSIQNYVPYDLWRPMPPALRVVVDVSLSSYRHELLLENTKGIHIQQQHGGVDDNVPAYHSRLMRQLIREADSNSSYAEIEGANHWFDGIMTTETLTSFYKQELGGLKHSVRSPDNFTLVVANPADTGSKYGVQVLQLLRPGQPGKASVSFSTSPLACSIRTSNVLSLRLPNIYPQTHDVILDGQELDIPLSAESSDMWLSPDGTWEIVTEERLPALRQGKQLGAMDALLRTQNTLQIVSHSSKARHTALQISRNLCQYFSAGTDILDGTAAMTKEYSNAVHVVVSDRPPPSKLEHFAVHIDAENGVVIRTAEGRTRTCPPQAGLGAVFLRPLPHDAVELVVWGFDEEGLGMAARLIPMLTGVGQPDFVVTDKRMRWQGAGGVLAMGFFDHLWNVTVDSYIM